MTTSREMPFWLVILGGLVVAAVLVWIQFDDAAWQSCRRLHSEAVCNHTLGR